MAEVFPNLKCIKVASKTADEIYSRMFADTDSGT